MSVVYLGANLAGFIEKARRGTVTGRNIVPLELDTSSKYTAKSALNRPFHLRFRP